MMLNSSKQLVLALGLLAAVGPAWGQSADFSAGQKAAIEQIVRDYLMKNPQVIFEAARSYQEQQQRQRDENAKAQLMSMSEDVFRDPASPVAGNPRGDVTVVEFFDYQCGYCKTVLDDVRQLLKADPKVRFVFKEYPILGPNSVVAARAALASREQGKYLEFHNALMETKGQLDQAAIERTARSVGIDVERLKRDMAKPEIDQALRRNRQLGDALDIQGTPGFIVGNQIVPGALDLDRLKALVAEARSKS
jgi:protein-disulfide isomerase